MAQVTITTTAMGMRVPVDKRGMIIGSSLNLGEFIKRYGHWQFDKITNRWVQLNEFFHFDADNEMCYFPKFDLEELKAFLTKNAVSYDVAPLKPVEGKHVSFMMLPHVSFKNDKQKGCVEFLTDSKVGPIRGVALQTGSGKSQPLDANIKTPQGWMRMGDVKLDQEVIAHDGTTTNVVGVYPQGETPTYRISFEDGRSTECSADHLWNVNYVQWKDKWRTVTTEQIAKYLTKPTYKVRMGIPLVVPEIKDDIVLPVEPYALGVLLGDGSLQNGTTRVSKPDQFVKDELDQVLHPTYKTSDWHADRAAYSIASVGDSPAIRYVLKDLGLWDTHSHTKFIPDVYMNASANQRLSLLQGLMDTDGTVGLSAGRGNDTPVPGKGGSCQYCTTSATLAEQVQELIRSLGGLCKITEKKSFYTYKDKRKAGRLAYILNIRIKDPKSLFRLPRKKNLVPDNYQYADRLKLRIKSVDYVGDKETQCIEVSHPDHLYVTDNYVVTHNTVSVFMGLQRIGRRSMITMTSRLEQWVAELGKYTTLDEDDIYVIQGVGSLTKLFAQIDKGINPKIILGSTSTMRRYLEYGPTYQHLPHPSLMCEKLNIGIVGTDEFHEHFYTNFLMGIILNPDIFMPITATFIANDPFVKTIFDKFIPKNIQFEGGDYVKFVNVTAYQYTSAGHLIKPYNYMSPQGYSQQMFEKFLMSQKGRKVLDALIEDAILPIIRIHYSALAEKGEKLLFLCSSTKLCDHLEGIFRRKFSDKTVSVFYSGMPVTILEKFDIILSTPGSAGTGRDVKNLRTCFAFESTGSETRNLQFIGRLRGPPQMMNTPEFVYLSLTAIPQHIKYHGARSVLYGPRALTFKHRTIS